MPNNKLHKAVLRNLVATKQHWPQLRKPQLRPQRDAASAVPPVANIQRITGQAWVDHYGTDEFLSGGLADITRIINIAEVYGFTGGSVMEWGVGCGRLARHLPQALRADFVGTDIDSVNIAWCAENLSFGKFHKLDPYGQVELPEKSLDLVYGISVMTHLTEQDQDHWLQALARVTRGLLVLSVHGMFSVAATTAWSQEQACFSSWLESGYSDAGTENPDIRDVAPAGYYRDTAHTPAYIADRWGKFVDVLDIIPGALSEHHDAVVCAPLKQN